MTSTFEMLKKINKTVQCRMYQKCYLTRTGLVLYGTFHGLSVVNEGNGSVLTT